MFTRENVCVLCAHTRMPAQCDPMLKAYGTYMENHERALQELERQEKRRPARLEAVLEQLRAVQTNKAWTLEMYLITPVQRLLRYTLLFRDYRAHTRDGSAEAGAADALQGARAACAAAVNASVRREQNALQLRRVRDSFASVPRDVADVILGDHLFVREGALTKVCRKTNMRRYFWLFSDCLLYGAAAAQGYVFHRYLPLARMRVKSLADTDEVANAFQIISAEKSFTVIADTPCEKDFWLLDLTEALGQGRTHALAQEVYTGGQASTEADAGDAPVWVPDKLAARCMVCGASFSVIRRRHHCRNCGKVVCGACSAQKRVIPGLDLATPERVCKFCYDLLAIQEAERSGSSSSTSTPATPSASASASALASDNGGSSAGSSASDDGDGGRARPPVLRRQASMPAVRLPLPPDPQQLQQRRLVRTQSQLPSRPPPVPPPKPRRTDTAPATPTSPAAAGSIGSPKPPSARLLVQPPPRPTGPVSHVHSASAGATTTATTTTTTPARRPPAATQQGSPRPLRRAPAPPEQQQQQKSVSGDEVAALREKVARYEAELAALRARCAALEEENARLRQQQQQQQQQQQGASTC